MVAAVIIAMVLARTRFAWFAITAAYATMVATMIGIGFSPLTAGRKIMLLVLLAPLIGLAADRLAANARSAVAVLSVAAGAVAVWVFFSVLVQREGAAAWGAGIGIAAFVAVLVAAVLALRDDGLRTGAAGLGLGLATGIAAVLSASLGFMIGGIAIAAAAGALLFMQVVTSRPVPAGAVGALSIGLATALIAAGSLMLAELPWYALPALLLIPFATRLPVPERAPTVARAALPSLYALAAASVTVVAAWYAARGSLF